MLDAEKRSQSILNFNNTFPEGTPTGYTQGIWEYLTMGQDEFDFA